MSASPSIKIENITKLFGEFRALNGVSLEVEPGEKVVVCGPSGSGKSTLIRCINGLEIHDEGKIEVAGNVLTDKPASLKAVRAYIPGPNAESAKASTCD